MLAKKSKKQSNEDTTIWDIKRLQSSYRDPHLMLIDLRNSGVFRGGPPPNPKDIPSEYHQGHIFLALNLNLENATTNEEIENEIQTGVNSAGGSFLDTLILAITSGFHFLFYDQDGSNMELFERIRCTPIYRNDEVFEFPKSKVHWLDGGFIAIHNDRSLRKYCADTKTLLGFEEDIEEPEYSEVLPHLFVGGAICSHEQLQELRAKGVEHIINVSNIERNHDGFKCTFIYADDDQTELLTRLFYQVADIIEQSEIDGEGVFVHCQRGLSRSPTLVMAYLMIKKQKTLREAFELVKAKRPNIGPRSNFMTQLCRLELELSRSGEYGENSKKRDLIYSLPMQVYELTSMRCANYEESIEFLLSPKRKKGFLKRYRNFLRTM